VGLKHSGKLLIRFGDAPAALPGFAALIATPHPAFAGFSLTPLFADASQMPALHAQTFAATPSAGLAQRWAIARPLGGPAPANAWDHAHEAAAQAGYQHYVEPDILHEGRGPNRFTPLAAPVAAATGAALVTDTSTFSSHWPPTPMETAGPGWHLQTGYTDFAGAHASGVTGTGIRIAHLDTGYDDAHPSKPRRLLVASARDFTVDPPANKAIDPGTTLPFQNPGHGTATLAVVAGARLTLTLNRPTGPPLTFTGDIGGAPDADVVPVRISESVIHVYTSTMAQGLDYALQSGCDVVTLSHGGVPTRAWAAAVNRLYDGGVVVAAASGDSFYYKVITLATHFTVYPSAFNRVITVCGATFDRTPYVTSDFAQMQGCWGPETVMEKAVSAYTPNIAWMQMGGGYTMGGSGTSASTPQVAAACALWLQLNAASYPTKDWRRVEACRLALFASAADNAKDRTHLGWGVLSATAMLDKARAARILASVQAGHVRMRPEDSVSFPLFRLIFGQGPPDSEENRMYETEVAQVALSSTNADLVSLAQHAIQGGLQPDEVETARQMLLAEDVSQPLRRALVAA
jgi:subtilisin family serine protease